MKKRTKQQWFELVAKQRDSGLSATEFCRNENLNPKYFSVRKMQFTKSGHLNEQAFMKVDIQKDKVNNLTIEHSYKNSKLNFSSLPNVNWLAELLKALS